MGSGPLLKFEFLGKTMLRSLLALMSTTKELELIAWDGMGPYMTETWVRPEVIPSTTLTFPGVDGPQWKCIKKKPSGR